MQVCKIAAAILLTAGPGVGWGQDLPGDPQAYSEGDVGWVADRPKFRLPDGTELPVRMSIVFAKEDGQWKMCGYQ